MEHSAKVIMLYSESGLYKTTNLAFAAKWLYGQYRKPVRLITAEASTQKIFESLMQAGIVEGLFIGNAANPLPVLRHLLGGEWPLAGKWAKAAPCGGYILEGLSTFAEMILEDLREKQRQIGQDVVGKFEEGCDCGAGAGKPHTPNCGVKRFANAAQSHYHFVQSEMLRNIKSSASLPAPYVLWSAHEAASEDEDTRAPIRGPALVGKKRIGAVQKYVSTLIHAEGYTAPGKKIGDVATVEQKVRLWFVRHPDSKFPVIEYPAKTTLPAARIPELMAAFPGGFIQPTIEHGLDTFLETEQRLSSVTANQLAEWKKEVDAIKEQKVVSE